MICPLRTPGKGTGASVKVRASLSGVRGQHLGNSIDGLCPGATKSADLRTQGGAWLGIALIKGCTERGMALEGGALNTGNAVDLPSLLFCPSVRASSPFL